MAFKFVETLYIKNLKAEIAEDAKVNLWNTGLEAARTGDSLQPVELQDLLPPCNTKEFAGTIEIPVYGNNNQYLRLAAGEEIAVKCASDAECAFYLAMNKEGILRVAETPAEEEVAEESVEE